MADSESPGFVPEAILETVVYCADLAAAREFYEKILGLNLRFVEPDRHLFFEVGNGMLLVFNPHNTRETTVHVGDQVIPRHGPDGATHFAFRVGDRQFDAIKRNLNAHGVDIESEIDWPRGGHSVYCRDPAGNSVEFATKTLWFHDDLEQ